MPKTKFEKITETCLRRGILYPDCEIYQPIAGFYTYGSVGTKIKRNWENYWRRYFLKGLGENFVELEGCMINPEPVFRASGHLEHFGDPITECRKCHNVERADHIVESHLNEAFEGLTPKGLDDLIRKHNIRCHECGGELGDVGSLNLMFGFKVGPYADVQAYLRPETTQCPAVSFKREYLANRERLPLGLAVVGRVFRNEISPRQFVFRMREFTQAEIQIFVDPDKINEHPRFAEIADYELNVVMADERDKGIQKLKASELVKRGYPAFYVYFMARESQFFDSLGIPKEKIRYYEKSVEERAFYNKAHFDAEMIMDSLGGYKEIAAIHYRTDHDLAGHSAQSKQDLSVTREGKKVLPHIVEITFGVDRNVFALLDSTFSESEKRTYFALPRQVAPHLAGVYPLVSKDGLDEKASEVFASLRNDFDVIYDDGGSIGRRYARADEVGVPLGITVDHQTLEDGTVTVRERDSTKQERIKAMELHKALRGFTLTGGLK